jgi:hypothetical protein
MLTGLLTVEVQEFQKTKLTCHCKKKPRFKAWVFYFEGVFKIHNNLFQFLNARVKYFILSNFCLK